MLKHKNVRVALTVVAAFALVGFGFFAADTFRWRTGWIADIAGGLAGNLLAAVIVFLLVDLAVENRLDEQRRTLREASIQPILVSLQDYANVLAWMAKNAAATVPDPQPKSLDELLGDTFFYDLQYFDLQVQPNVLPPVTWCSYLFVNTRQVCKELRAWAASSVSLSDPSDFEIVNAFLGSDFSSRPDQWCALCDTVSVPRFLFFRDASSRARFKLHVDAFCSLVRLVNEAVSPGVAIVVPPGLWEEEGPTTKLALARWEGDPGPAAVEFLPFT